MPPRLLVLVIRLNAQPQGPVSVAVTAALADRLNPGKIRIHFESDG